MNRAFAVLAIAIVAVAAAMYFRDGKTTSDAAVAMHKEKEAAASGVLSPAAVLKIQPTARSASPRPAPDLSKRSALAREVAEARDWKPIYDRLRNSPEGETPEGLYYLARLLSGCAQVTDRKASGAPRQSREERRAAFVASISEKDPQREARLAAYESTNLASRCTGFADVRTTEQEIKDLRARAAAAGEPKARAVDVAQAVFATANSQGPPGTGLPTITDSQLDALREIARSGDPVALQTIGSVLASTLGDLQIRAGPGEQPVDPRAFHDAWLLAACEYGANCGRDNGQVSSACAHQGRCGVDNLGDYLYYYGHSPAQSQNLGEYSQHLVNAIRTGDWSYFQFVRGAPSHPGSTYRFGGPW